MGSRPLFGRVGRSLLIGALPFGLFLVGRVGRSSGLPFGALPFGSFLVGRVGRLVVVVFGSFLVGRVVGRVG